MTTPDHYVHLTPAAGGVGTTVATVALAARTAARTGDPVTITGDPAVLAAAGIAAGRPSPFPIDLVTAPDGAAAVAYLGPEPPGIDDPRPFGTWHYHDASGDADQLPPEPHRIAPLTPHHDVLTLRNDYLSLRRAVTLTPGRPTFDGWIILADRPRPIGTDQVREVLGRQPIEATIERTDRIARAVDAGLLVARGYSHDPYGRALDRIADALDVPHLEAAAL